MPASVANVSQKPLVQILQTGTFTGLTDGDLLTHFLTRDQPGREAAFSALIERHGPMVLRVCRDLLGNSHDAQDAFQATFLVLVRRAASIRNRSSVQSWLFGVARRVAAQGRIEAARRRRIEKVATGRQVAEGSGQPDDELRAILDDELARLPEKYRSPVLLCDLEGLTYTEAAHRLGWAPGTVGVRLMRARHRLRDRLTRRGIGLSLGAIAALARSLEAATVVPAELTSSVVSASLHKSAVGLTLLTRVKAAAALLLAAGAIVTAGLAWAAGWQDGPKAESRALGCIKT